MNLVFNKFEQLHDDNFQILYELAQSKMKSINEYSDSLDKKSYALIFVYTLVFGALTVFYYLNPAYKTDSLTCFFLVNGFMGSVISILFGVVTKRCYSDGFMPSDVLNKITDDYYLSSHNRLLSVLIKFYDAGIKHNTYRSHLKSRWINMSIIIFLGYFFLFFIGFNLTTMEIRYE